MNGKSGRIKLIFVILAVVFCLSSPVFGQEGPAPSGKTISPSVREAGKSGTVTPGQHQEGVALPEEARVLRQFQKKSESGRLTAAELNTVKGLLEQTKGKGEPTETEEPIQQDTVYSKKVSLPPPPLSRDFWPQLFFRS